MIGKATGYCAILSLLESQSDASLDCDYLVIGFHLSAEETTVKAIVEDFNLFEFETVDVRRRRERDEHDANAITFDEYIRRKEVELQTERAIS